MFFILFLSFGILVESKCWTTKPYHVAAIAFAEGTGNLSSSSVCRYGNDTQIHQKCPNTCWGLITATWGDCYCQNPDYKPNVSNPFIKSMTVQEIFSLLATPQKYHFQGAFCQDKLNLDTNKKKWLCV